MRIACSNVFSSWIAKILRPIEWHGAKSPFFEGERLILDRRQAATPPISVLRSRLMQRYSVWLLFLKMRGFVVKWGSSKWWGINLRNQLWIILGVRFISPLIVWLIFVRSSRKPRDKTATVRSAKIFTSFQTHWCTCARKEKGISNMCEKWYLKQDSSCMCVS